MTRSFEGPQQFRHSLDERLRSAASRLGLPMDSLRTKVLIERLLARLFAGEHPAWILKGGYSLELRFRPAARTTRDIDLSVPEPRGASHAERSASVVDQLRLAAELDLHDFLRFEIGDATRVLGNPPLKGARYPVVARLGGREYGRLHVDVGFGDARIGKPDSLVGHDFMEFAGLQPARVLAISLAQQCAEKLHAYTRPWGERENTRAKDLVDLALLVERGRLRAATLRSALRETFATCATHPLPQRLPPAPAAWAAAYREEAQRMGLKAASLEAAESALRELWQRLDLD